MSDTSSKQVAPYGLRMSPELKERVAASAYRNSRSMNIEINHALEEYLTHEAQREEGFRWLPPDQQVNPQLLLALEEIAKAQEVPLKLMLDGAVSYLIGGTKYASDNSVAQVEADEILSDIMARGEDPGAAWLPRQPNGGKALSDAEMQELKDAVSATVAQELARLFGGAR